MPKEIKSAVEQKRPVSSMDSKLKELILSGIHFAKLSVHAHPHLGQWVIDMQAYMDALEGTHEELEEKKAEQND